MSYGIYKFENKMNNKVYIGQAFDLKKRYIKHCKNMNDISHKEDFYQALRKFGWNNFSYEIIEEYFDKPNREYLNEREIYWISYYNSYYDGYNMTPGGSNGAYVELCKPIEQYDLEGNFIAEYESAHAADRATKLGFSSICAVARGDRRHVGYFQWKYKEDDKKIKNIKNDIIIMDRPVGQYDLNYNLIKDFSSLKEASEITNISKSLICNCCKDKIKTAGGYIWRYKDNFFIGREKYKSNNYGKNIVQLDKENNIISEYSSALEAFRKTGISNTSIGKVCLGQRKTAGGYIWKFKKDYLDEKEN